VVTAFCLNLVNEASLRPRRRSLVRELRDENWRTAALDVMVAATQDDTDPPTLSAFDDGEGPPTVSSRCMKAFADAIWAGVQHARDVAQPGAADRDCAQGKDTRAQCPLAFAAVARIQEVLRLAINTVAFFA